MTILFLCVANSVRSQMAEGLAKDLFGDRAVALSAGVCSSYVHPTAIEVMAEFGIDISGQTSKAVSQIDLRKVDIVVTLCSEQVCPPVPATIRQLSWPMPDPSRMGNPSDPRDGFRMVRNAILKKLKELDLKKKDPP